MKTPTDQVDCQLLAEKVMGWKPTAFDFLKLVNGDDVASARWVGPLNEAHGWNPFANPADAILLMEVLPENIELWSKRRDGVYRLDLREQIGPVASRLMVEEKGADFARTLTAAICRLVKERPELFEVPIL